MVAILRFVMCPSSLTRFPTLAPHHTNSTTSSRFCVFPLCFATCCHNVPPGGPACNQEYSYFVHWGTPPPRNTLLVLSAFGQPHPSPKYTLFVLSAFGQHPPSPPGGLFQKRMRQKRGKGLIKCKSGLQFRGRPQARKPAFLLNSQSCAQGVCVCVQRSVLQMSLSDNC